MNLAERKQDRCNRANALLQVIASTGSRFFRHGSRVSQFYLDGRGRLWLNDRWNRKPVYTHYKGEWKHFSQGGTLKALCEALRDFVIHGKRFTFTGRHWGYGEDMSAVISAARALEILPAEPEPAEEFFLLSLKWWSHPLTWWKPNGNGYTWYLDEAGRYSAEDVKRRGYPDRDVAVIPCADVLAVAKLVAPDWLPREQGWVADVNGSVSAGASL